MSSIKLWVLTICAAAVLVTVLGYFIKSEKSFSVIKTVLALYILVTVFTPHSLVDIAQEIKAAPKITLAQTIDADLLVAQNATEMLRKQLNDKFVEKNINADCTELILKEDLSEVISVKLRHKSNDCSEIAAATAKELLGENIIVTE